MLEPGTVVRLIKKNYNPDVPLGSIGKIISKIENPERNRKTWGDSPYNVYWNCSEEHDTWWIKPEWVEVVE